MRTGPFSRSRRSPNVQNAKTGRECVDWEASPRISLIDRKRLSTCRCLLSVCISFYQHTCLSISLYVSLWTIYLSVDYMSVYPSIHLTIDYMSVNQSIHLCSPKVQNAKTGRECGDWEASPRISLIDRNKLSTCVGILGFGIGKKSISNTVLRQICVIVRVEFAILGVGAPRRCRTRRLGGSAVTGRPLLESR